MSVIKVRQPISHIPTFNEYPITLSKLYREIIALGLHLPMDMLDSCYYFTDIEGWSKILPDLCFNSNLYKKDKFDCDNYALKAMNICAERYGLNTLALVIGDMPLGRHAFNMLYFGEGFMLFEPNEGYGITGAFGFGENNYRAELVLI